MTIRVFVVFYLALLLTHATVEVALLARVFFERRGFLTPSRAPESVPILHSSELSSCKGVNRNSWERHHFLFSSWYVFFFVYLGHGFLGRITNFRFARHPFSRGEV